jgi:hypothetical protein
MTREEAIAIIRKEYLCVDRDCDIERSCGKCDLMMPSKEPILEAYEMAIKALKQQTCEDAVSRQVVLEIIRDFGYKNDHEEMLINERIKALPSVNPQYTEAEIQKMQEMEQAEIQKAYELGTKMQPCEDCISRQAVLDVIDDIDKTTCMNEYHVIVDAIDKLPSVNPQPKTGHWIDIMVGDMPAQACDQCNTFYPLAYTGGGHKYCPNCGCRMVEPQESEETHEKPIRD